MQSRKFEKKKKKDTILLLMIDAAAAERCANNAANQIVRHNYIRFRHGRVEFSSDVNH